MYKYSLIIIHLKTMSCLVSKIQDNDIHSFVEYNVTEDNKMNRTKNNEHK